MNSALQQLLQRPDIWRKRDRRLLTNAMRAQNTGFTALDRELHGGWPRAALIELLLVQPGVGELFLLAPLLRELSQQQRLQVWINPPLLPYAPALTQRGIDLDNLLIVQGESRHHLWACEQALRSAACGAVLYWPAQTLRYAELRKLQVAAAAQQAIGFLLRDNRCANQTSPAVLRLQLQSNTSQLSIQIMKQRGQTAGKTLFLPREEVLQSTPLLSEHPAQKLFSEKTATPSQPPRKTPSRIIPLPSQKYFLSSASSSQ